jgi:hypothetical protein
MKLDELLKRDVIYVREDSTGVYEEIVELIVKMICLVDEYNGLTWKKYQTPLELKDVSDDKETFLEDLEAQSFKVQESKKGQSLITTLDVFKNDVLQRLKVLRTIKWPINVERGNEITAKLNEKLKSVPEIKSSLKMQVESLQISKIDDTEKETVIQKCDEILSLVSDLNVVLREHNEKFPKNVVNLIAI